MPEFNTRLRHLSAKDPAMLEAALERLPTKVEIKGGPVFVKGRWFLYFTIPDNMPGDLPFGDLDG